MTAAKTVDAVGSPRPDGADAVGAARPEGADGVGPPRPKRADARRNYDRIVAAARTAFAAHGPDAPLDEIARRAGVGAGTLYRHFPHREELVEAVYRDSIGDLSGRAYQLLEELPPAEALAVWMREMVDFVVRERGIAVALKAALDHHSETFAWCKATSRAAATLLLERGQEAGEIRTDVTATELLHLCHGVAVAAEHAPELADRLLGVVLDGLRAKD